MDPHALPRYEGNAAQALILPLIALAATGTLPVLGHRKDGTPIYPIAGGAEDPTGEQIEALTAAILALKDEKQADAAGLPDSHPSRERSKAALSPYAPSKARLIASGSGLSDDAANRPAQASGHAGLKAALGDRYQPGDLITGLALLRSHDHQDQIKGKALMDATGLRYEDVPVGTMKATLGTTGATGGYVLPNNLVDTVVKPAVSAIDWTQALTLRDNVAVRAVDQPYRMGAPLRMTAQNWGATKESVDENYGSYTSTLGTFARIYDISKQYARFSAGAAEQDVMDELAKAARLAIEYSVLAGPGTGAATPGVNDPTLGLYTSLNGTPTFLGYKSAKTGAASASTIIGAFASAVAEMAGLMAARGRFPTVVVVDSITFWAALTQGSDTASFWVSPTGNNNGFTIDANGNLSYWGIAIRHTPNFNTYTGTTKAAIALDGAAFKLYRGQEFRIDSSDTAGNRWDQNLIGYRGEFELGFNAETGVHVGAAQLMTAVIP